MGTLFSAMDIARSGLQASQIQLDTAGHNIANVNTEGYSRQRVTLKSRLPNFRSYGALGRGVQVMDIARIRESFLDDVYRMQSPDLGYAEVRATYFTRIEDAFQEPEENGLGVRINDFFDALNDLANQVEEQPVRVAVLQEADSLAAIFRQTAERLYLLRTNANEEARNLVPEINSLTSQIASLNDHIRTVEFAGRTANDLRDERDLLLDQLSERINITARERADGQVDVLVSGETLVNGDRNRELTAIVNSALDPERGDLVEIRFADTNTLVPVRSGELAGALSMRDGELVAYDARVDQMAAAIIEAVNDIHSQANGLANLSGTLESTNAVTDPAVPLNTAGLPFTVTPGTFDVVVYDAANNPTTTAITVTAATTLNDLIADLNGVANFNAALNADADGLELGADPGFTYVFANNTTGALTALGIDGLFTGSDARTMALNPVIEDNPNLLASSYSLDVLETGDNTAAIAMAEIRDALLLESGTASINDYYESTIAAIGVDARANVDMLDVEQAFVEDFDRRRQEVSGVSLDEEVTLMMQYQRAFEASARVISTVNTMLDTLLNI